VLFWGFASNLAIPFFAVYMLVRLGFPLSWVIGFSILSQLGFIPADMELDAVEISRSRPGGSDHVGAETGDYRVVTFSDAHRLDDIGLSYTTFYIHKPCIAELKLAFQGLNGRKLQSEPN